MSFGFWVLKFIFITTVMYGFIIELFVIIKCFLKMIIYLL